MEMGMWKLGIEEDAGLTMKIKNIIHVGKAAS